MIKFGINYLKSYLVLYNERTKIAQNGEQNKYKLKIKNKQGCFFV